MASNFNSMTSQSLLKQTGEESNLYQAEPSTILETYNGMYLYSIIFGDDTGSGPNGTLVQVYYQRSDLQNAFPNAETDSASYTGLMSWAGQVALHNSSFSGYYSDGSYNTLKPYGMYYVLLWIYNIRGDLQSAFPNAYWNSNSYQGLIDWADSVVSNVTGYGSDGGRTHN